MTKDDSVTINVGSMIVTVGVCQLLGIVGAAIASREMYEWFIHLELPVEMFPVWLLNPIWLLLYTLMGLSLYFYTKHDWSRRQVKMTLWLFATVYILNALRPVFMFTWHDLMAGFVGGALQVLALLLTMIVGYRVSRAGSWLLLPQFLFVSFSLYVNYEIWRLNT